MSFRLFCRIENLKTCDTLCIRRILQKLSIYIEYIRYYEYSEELYATALIYDNNEICTKITNENCMYIYIYPLFEIWKISKWKFGIHEKYLINETFKNSCMFFFENQYDVWVCDSMIKHFYNYRMCYQSIFPSIFYNIPLQILHENKLIYVKSIIYNENTSSFDLLIHNEEWTEIPETKIDYKIIERNIHDHHSLSFKHVMDEANLTYALQEGWNSEDSLMLCSNTNCKYSVLDHIQKCIYCSSNIFQPIINQFNLYYKQERIQRMYFNCSSSALLMDKAIVIETNNNLTNPITNNIYNVISKFN